MPVYEYRCRTCGADFELRRPMSESAAAAPCPDGHDDTLRRVSMVTTIGASVAAAGGGGGCCGGGCGCSTR